MTEKRRRSRRQRIEIEQVKSDPNSFLSWGIADPVLEKLETYRLYQAGYAVADIAAAFGLSHGYLYEMWAKLKVEGTEGLVDKRWGTGPRQRTSEREAAVLRAKALAPRRSDADLASQFQMDRSTVYHLLKEHGLQDLHRVLAGAPPSALSSDDSDRGEKKASKSSLVKRR
jgi:transposase